MKHIEAVLFDLDGTLIHTYPRYRYTIVRQALEELETTASQEDIDKFWFESSRNETIKTKFRVDPKTFWPIYRRYDNAEFREECIEPYPDVDFIKELKQRGYKTGIVTGAPVHIANLEIGVLGEENFDAIVIAHSLNNVKPKPHPQGLEQCLNILKVQKSRATYVGNSRDDIETAENAGVFPVLVKRKEYDFKGINPSLTINSLYELRGPLGL